MQPFIKCLGGKRQIVKELLQRVPNSYKRYYEPFVGGGALLFNLKPQKFIISDLNKELIIAYQAIAYQYNNLTQLLFLFEKNHSENFYYQIRSIEQEANENLPNKLKFKHFPKLLIAARFIYLNKSCFNGLFRVNSKGYFNVPKNKKETVKTFNYDNLKAISRFLKNKKAKILNSDFEKIVVNSEKDDFIYFDPPYDYDQKGKGFDAYQKNGFKKEGQKRLAKVCHELNAKGVKFMLSNHNTKLIRQLYQNFNIEIIEARRAVNSNGNKRGKVEEVIIRNYV